MLMNHSLTYILLAIPYLSSNQDELLILSELSEEEQSIIDKTRLLVQEEYVALLNLTSFIYSSIDSKDRFYATIKDNISEYIKQFVDQRRPKYCDTVLENSRSAISEFIRLRLKEINDIPDHPDGRDSLDFIFYWFFTAFSINNRACEEDDPSELREIVSLMKMATITCKETLLKPFGQSAVLSEKDQFIIEAITNRNRRYIVQDLLSEVRQVIRENYLAILQLTTLADVFVPENGRFYIKIKPSISEYFSKFMAYGFTDGKARKRIYDFIISNRAKIGLLKDGEELNQLDIIYCIFFSATSLIANAEEFDTAENLDIIHEYLYEMHEIEKMNFLAETCFKILLHSGLPAHVECKQVLEKEESIHETGAN